jgi:hypothetical protein
VEILLIVICITLYYIILDDAQGHITSK